MNKQDYLDLLRYYLRDLPEIIVNDIVYDYEEHFNVGIESGKTEEQIADELGSPDDIAKEYLGADVHKKKHRISQPVYEEKESNIDGWVKWALIIAGIIFLGPIVISIVGAAFGIIVGIMGALFGGGVGLIGGAIGLFFSIFFENGLSGMFFFPFSVLTKIFGSIFMAALGIFFIGLGVKFVKFVYKSVIDLYVSIRWKLER